MKKERFLIIIGMALIYGIISCDVKVNDSDIFNGEIKTIDDKVKTVVELEPHEMIFDGITYGFPFIYDSLMFFYNNKLPNRYYSIFNIKTGKHIGDFCPRGQGPGEARVISPIYQIYKENGELKTLLCSPYNFKLIIWNISKSIDNNKTVWDFVPYDWRKNHDEFCNNFIARLNSEEFICIASSLCMNPDEDCTNSTVPSYEKRSIYSDTLVEKYTIFKQPVKCRYSDQLFKSHDCIKPDGSKIVQFMIRMWQINTIDIETGEITGYRPKEEFPGFSYPANFSEPFEETPIYFMRAVSNDRYIAALYCNGIKGGNMNSEDIVVYVFDWDCNLLKKIKLKSERPYYDFVLNNDNNLYTIGMNDEGETICRYDLKSVGL
jgi:hypothetical protein